MRALLLMFVIVAGLGGCRKYVGEYDGEVKITVLRSSLGSSKEEGVDEKSYPVHVSVRPGKAPVKTYPQGELVLELAGGPFKQCVTNVYDTSGREGAINISHEEPCLVSVDGYTGPFPGQTFVGFVKGEEIVVVANGPVQTDASGKVRGQLNVTAKRVR